ncbi:MAG TPA: hypothetical protein VIM71_02200 [Lacunisphaera sp.]
MIYVAEKTTSVLPGVLVSPGRAPEISEADDAYGWLVGSWELDVIHYGGRNVSNQLLKGEAHFSWVLEGRAIQDVWIMPRRFERRLYPDRSMNMYGSTLRAWDAALKGWRITWANPAGAHYESQIGRWQGGDVVQTGTRPDGTATRWSFREITADSFHWFGEARPATGANGWTLEGEFRAHRTAGR